MNETDEKISIPASLDAFIMEGTAADVRMRYARLPQAAQELDFGKYASNIVVLDTETTGVSFSHDELTQIAAARIEKGNVVARFSTFVNPGREIPEEIVHLTGIDDACVATAPSPYEAVAALVEFVGDARIVAHNAAFDKNFTTKQVSGYSLLENEWIDSLDISRITLPRLKSHRLIDLVKAFDAPLSTHRADADVEATCALWGILLAAIVSMPPALLARVGRLASSQEWETGQVFAYFAAQQGCNGIPFNLRTLRAQRIAALPNTPPKFDAEDVAADPQRGLNYPPSPEVRKAFSEEGMLAALYESYEPRVEQRAMAEAVNEAFASGRNLVIEAGTGVGKSMAYLVPAALLARENNISVGIATKTNALLDQLMYSELPALEHQLPGLTWQALKGFSHYPCLRRIERLEKQGAEMVSIIGQQTSTAPSLAALLSFIEQSEFSDLDGLKIDYRALRRQNISCTSHECLRRKCPYFGGLCFVHGARRRAERADIVVTNHSLLFCDLAADGALLPPIRYWVVDEAHGAENEARQAFAQRLDVEDMLRQVARLKSGDPARNVLIRAERLAGSAEGAGVTLLESQLAHARRTAEVWCAASEELAQHVKDLLYFDKAKHGKGYETVELWINDDARNMQVWQSLRGFARLANEASEKLITVLQGLVALFEDVEGSSSIQQEIAVHAMDLKERLSACNALFEKAGEDDYVYSAQLNRKMDRNSDKLVAQPLYVSELIQERLYAQTHSVVYTSATLAVHDSFESFEQAMGLSGCMERLLSSSYNYDENMIVYVPDDIPEPSDPGYLDALSDLLVAVHRANEGSMLTLFTNRREMEKCYAQVQPALKSEGLRLVCQKWGVSTKGLRDDFIADKHLSLFALKSFWEGFDAPGSTLSGVVIPKLPFAKPTDPLSCERSLHDDAAWRHYVLPAAILETKQAAGRLIRKADDHGVLILADKRLLTKSYGKAVLSSMPSRNVRICSSACIAREISACYLQNSEG